MTLVGFSHTENGDLCSDHPRVTNIFTEYECKAAVGYAITSLSSDALFKDTVSRENEPKGCYIVGRYVYWNTHSTGGPNIKAKSICKSGKRSRNIPKIIQ